MSAVLRTQTIDERQGFMKALVAARDDHILGKASHMIVCSAIYCARRSGSAAEPNRSKQDKISGLDRSIPIV
jgi:hypothetical protein